MEWGREGRPAASLNASSSQNAAESIRKDGGNKRPREGIVLGLPQTGKLIWGALWSRPQSERTKGVNMDGWLYYNNLWFLKGRHLWHINLWKASSWKVTILQWRIVSSSPLPLVFLGQGFFV